MTAAEPGDANVTPGLSEDERDSLSASLINWLGEEEATDEEVYGTVERILAARAQQATADHDCAESCCEHGIQYGDLCDYAAKVANGEYDPNPEATADHEAALRVRLAAVEAVAAGWEAEADEPWGHDVLVQTYRNHARELRAALAAAPTESATDG